MQLHAEYLQNLPGSSYLQNLPSTESVTVSSSRMLWQPASYLAYFSVKKTGYLEISTFPNILSFILSIFCIHHQISLSNSTQFICNNILQIPSYSNDCSVRLMISSCNGLLKLRKKSLYPATRTIRSL